MARPRILIDGRLLAYRRGGIQRYVLGLASAFARLDHGFELLLVRNRRVDAPLPAVRVLTPPHHRWERSVLGLELALRRPALVHSPDFIPPRLPRSVRRVATVHDLAFLDNPQLLSAEARRYYGQLAEALSAANRIIAVSQWTAARLRQAYPALADRVRVVHNGVDDRFFHPLPVDPWHTIEEAVGPERVRQLRERSLVLAVGTIEPRKRYPLLVGALERLWSRSVANAPILVVVGQAGWCDDGAVTVLQSAIDRGLAIWLRDASDDALRALYAVATMLVIPSLDEGFCLPAAEAMASGLPVLAARRGALPEILDEAGEFVDSDCPEVWAQEIGRLMGDELRRRTLAQRGLQRAPRFRWEQSARQTLALYREALEG